MVRLVKRAIFYQVKSVPILGFPAKISRRFKEFDRAYSPKYYDHLSGQEPGISSIDRSTISQNCPTKGSDGSAIHMCQSAGEVP